MNQKTPPLWVALLLVALALLFFWVLVNAQYGSWPPIQIPL